MFTRLLRTLQSLVQFSFLRVAMEKNARQHHDDLDIWLFEDMRKTHSVASLPAYPRKDVLTDGEAHRLDMLSAAVDDLSKSISQILERSLKASATQGLAKRASDIVITDFLFEDHAQVEAVDSDLFDVFPTVQETSTQNQLIAASQTGRFFGPGVGHKLSELRRGG